MNLALVLDGSGSVNKAEFKLEQGFAKDTVAAFADRNLFDNGGTASYVQYAKRLASSDTFGSASDFNDFVDADKQAEGGTTTSVGINEGTRLLGINPASASFMIVITDGRSSSISATRKAADAARAEGIIVVAVGVGGWSSHTSRCRDILSCGIVATVFLRLPVRPDDAGKSCCTQRPGESKYYSNTARIERI